MSSRARRETTAPPAFVGRFHAIDALRGYAAVAVVAFHLVILSPQAPVFAAALPFSQAVAPQLVEAVTVFFVVSGLVVGISASRIGTRARDSAVFVLRRLVRLTPPYWAAIAAVLVLGVVEAFAGFGAREFSLGDIALNLLYLQDLAGAPSVIVIAWTLCLEVQFYVLLAAVVYVAGRLAGGDAHRRQSLVRPIVLAGAAASLVLPASGPAWATGIVQVWWVFALGMTLAWLVLGQVGTGYAATVVGVAGVILGVRQALGGQSTYGVGWFAWVAAALVFALVVGRRLSWTGGRVSQFLGRISYSLYLVHMPVIAVSMGAVMKLGTGPWALALALVVGASASLVAATLLNVCVEGPAYRWSERLKQVLRRRRRARPSARVALSAGA